MSGTGRGTGLAIGGGGGGGNIGVGRNGLCTLPWLLPLGCRKTSKQDKNYTKNQLLGTSNKNNLVKNYVQYIYSYLKGGKESAGSNSPWTSRSFVSNSVNLVTLWKIWLLNTCPISSLSELRLNCPGINSTPLYISCSTNPCSVRGEAVFLTPRIPQFLASAIPSGYQCLGLECKFLKDTAH